MGKNGKANCKIFVVSAAVSVTYEVGTLPIMCVLCVEASLDVGFFGGGVVEWFV